MKPKVLSNKDTSGPALVLAATGKTGRRAAQRLETKDVPFRQGSRSAIPPFDWKDARGWGDCLVGVRAVYINDPTYVSAMVIELVVGAIAVVALRRGDATTAV